MTIGFEGASQYGELVNRVFGADEIVPPGIQLADSMPSGGEPDWWIWKRKYLYSFRNSLVAQAAISNGLGILNPAGSRNIITITRIVPNSGNANSTVSSISPLPLQANYVNAGNQTAPHDGRYAGANLPVNVISKNVGGLTGFGTSRLVIQSTQTPDDYFEVIPPGFWVAIENTAVNTVLDITIFGYIKQARNEELAQ